MTAYIDPTKFPVFVAAIVCTIIILFAVLRRSHSQEYRLRQIPGLQAIEDAIGRATEMARPVLYTPGWGGDIQRPTTIASMSILSHVAEKTALYNCPLLYPTHDPVIMSVAQEVVRESYAKGGFADRYVQEQIRYVSSSQFGYAAAVEGMITRSEPAAVFLLGTFEAESLIMAESGNSVGAIQIAGTDSTIQLAFFIVACDYTLIGEELFAASGYLSNDRAILASIWAQDILKVAIAVFLIVAAVWAAVAPTSTWWRF